MLRKLRLRTWGLLAGGVLPLVIAGCPRFRTPGDESAEAKLVPFGSPGELLSYFKEQARARTQGRWGGRGLFPFGAMAPVPAGAEGGLADTAHLSGGAADGDSQSFSTTNIQEVGVDESDVVKSDGTYFYIARGESLRIVRATPAGELVEVSRLDLDLRVSEMYLHGTKVLLLAQRYEGYDDRWSVPAIEIWPPYFVGSDLVVVEVDVSDPNAPVATKQVDLDGALVSSRLTNGRLILVLTVAPQLPADATPLAIGLMTLDEVMPNVHAGGATSDMVAWQDCLHPESPDGYFLTAVVTLDADDIETIVDSVAVMANAGTIYASTAALYVTDAEYDPDDIYREQTAIHKFAFDENGAAQYAASGSVPGRLLNQFSLGEHEGYLRVATHVTNPRFFGMFDGVAIAVADTAQGVEPPSDFNAVYVLRQTGGTLEVTGTIEGIAPNEQLHSARFLGGHGFLVTYRKVDPLFVLDLRDPADPRVVGELKVPGFSDYLHPFGDDHLIGVGKYTSPTARNFDWFQGVQISLFDVSDWSNPTAVEQIQLGGRGSWSEVDATHKGFTFMPDRGLLAIPMHLFTVEETPPNYGELEFAGVVVFRVDTEAGLTELGRLDMEEWTESNKWNPWWWSRPDDEWMRAAVIGDTLYAISADGVAAAPLADLEGVTTLELDE